MNKLCIYLVLAGLMVGLLAACAQGTLTLPPPPGRTAAPEAPKAAALPKTLSIGALPMGTAFSGFAIAQADVIKRNTGMEVLVDPSPNPMAILSRLLKERQTDIAITMGFHVWNSFNDKASAAPNIQDIRHLYRYTTFTYGYVVRGDSGVKTVPDLKGKKVMANWPANRAFNTMANEAILNGFGMTMNDIVALDYSNPAEAIRAVIEGKAVASFDSLRGGAMHEELARTAGGYILPIPHDQKTIKAVKAKAPFLEPATVPGGRALAKSDVPVIADNSFLSVRKDMDENVAYTLVKTLIENVDDLTRLNPDLAEGTLKNALIGPVAPYHPGAVRYFKEKKVWTKEMDSLQAKLLEMAK